MHCWYWISDFCENLGIDFILGHALYVKAIHGGNFPLAYVYPKEMRATRDLLRRRTKIVRHGAYLKAHVSNTTSQYNLPNHKVNLKNVSAREQVKVAFPDPVVQRNIDLDMAVLDCYAYAQLTGNTECSVAKRRIDWSTAAICCTRDLSLFVMRRCPRE